MGQWLPIANTVWQTEDSGCHLLNQKDMEQQPLSRDEEAAALHSGCWPGFRTPADGAERV